MLVGPTLPLYTSLNDVSPSAKPGLSRKPAPAVLRCRAAMDQDTSMGGDHGRFPQTRHSAIQALQSDDPEQRHGAYGAVIAAYWKPSYKFIRIRWSATNEEAKDLTQGFFARALEKNFFLGYDPAVGSFRTYLRTCLERFVVNQKKPAGREKRGG